VAPQQRSRLGASLSSAAATSPTKRCFSSSCQSVVATAINSGAFECAAWSIRALLVRIIDKNALGLQVWIRFVAGIAEKQSLAAIADEDESMPTALTE
jgi:hypothetical protein